MTQNTLNDLLVRAQLIQKSKRYLDRIRASRSCVGMASTFLRLPKQLDASPCVRYSRIIARSRNSTVQDLSEAGLNWHHSLFGDSSLDGLMTQNRGYVGR